MYVSALFCLQTHNMVLYETIFSFTKKFNPEDARRQLMEIVSIVNKHKGVVLSVQDLGWRRTSQKAKLKPQGCFWYGRWMSVAYGAQPDVVRDVNDCMSKCLFVLRFTTERISKNRQSLFLSRMQGPNRAAYSLPVK